MRRRTAHVVVFLLLLALAGAAPPLDGWATAANIKAEYHFRSAGGGGGLRDFWDHDKALEELAVAGNDHALRRFLEMSSKSDGARAYGHFNLMVDCLRKVGDARFARIVNHLNPEERACVWHYLSGIGDLTSSAPLTYAAVGTSEHPNPTALPLRDPGLVWP
jgi:hypothetical protein